LIAKTRGGARRLEIEELCREHGVAVEVISERALAALGVSVHNGFAAELAAGQEAPAVNSSDREGDRELVVLLEDVQDPRNLGAVLRVCEGAGVGRVLIRDRGSAPISPLAVRTSAGAAEWLDIERVTNSSREIEDFKKAGFWVYGAAMGGVPPWELDLSGKVVLCLGGEEKGLRSNTRDHCDALVGLPMRGRVESLNIATASAALLFEALRQRVAVLKMTTRERLR
jgi:23S rRNA (guanosine2251-2'-O)-methyltransferase